MPRLAIQDEKITFDEFTELELEAPADERWELIGGFIFRMMTGGTVAHNEIVTKIAARLLTHFERRNMPCRAYTENVKLAHPALNLSAYPDLVVRCGPRKENLAAIDDPVAIVEVHSPSTRDKDRGQKLHAYQQIPTVQQYVMIEAKEALVQVLRRRGADWLFEAFDNKDDVVDVPSLDFRITVGDIYDGVVEVKF
jgi:Uma2 family endonuclease